MSQRLSVSIVAANAATVTNLSGGGAIALPLSGWQLVVGVALYTVAMDFAQFLFHRAQHRIPALLALHSLHHNDDAMNFSTATRYFWAEQALKTVTIYPCVGLLFHANAPIVASYSIIMMSNLFFHSNVPIGFGRAWFLLNSPQYHRVHHSVLPEHRDKNFAALSPIFDAIFRTAHRPRANEFLETGLYDHDRPRAVTEAIIWPARGFSRSPRGSLVSVDQVR